MNARGLAPIPASVIDDVVLAALDEDAAQRDVTSMALVAPNEWGRGVFVVKATGVLAGLPVAAAAMTALDDSVSFDEVSSDGDWVEDGTAVAEVEGRLASLLAAERVALNFLQRLSGIATLTRHFVDAVRGTNARILDTRKTTPGLRHLERYAVRAGGGQNHRFNLADGVLIKDNHIAAARQRGVPSLAQLVTDARAAAPHTLRIEIEVTSLDDLKDVLDAAPDIVLLDNLPVDEMRRCVDLVAGRAKVEASGGVTLANVGDIAATGVDYISVGALTHSAPALDISFEARGV